jgi:ParB-like chromosome segregation protein Spo0J
MTQAELAAKTGKSVPYISQRLTLLKNTAPEVKEAVENGVISPTHARELVSLPKDQQLEVLQDVLEKKKSGQKVSVSSVKEEADRRKATLPPRKGKKGPVYDQEKVKLAREMFDGKELSCRPRTAILEQMGALCQQAERTQSDVTKQAIKHKMAALEWVTGGRETL